MRVMVMVKATKESEAENNPLEIEGAAEMFEAMGKLVLHVGPQGHPEPRTVRDGDAAVHDAQRVVGQLAVPTEREPAPTRRAATGAEAVDREQHDRRVEERHHDDRVDAEREAGDPPGVGRRAHGKPPVRWSRRSWSMPRSAWIDAEGRSSSQPTAWHFVHLFTLGFGNTRYRPQDRVRAALVGVTEADLDSAIRAARAPPGGRRGTPVSRCRSRGDSPNAGSFCKPPSHRPRSATRRQSRKSRWVKHLDGLPQIRRRKVQKWHGVRRDPWTPPSPARLRLALIRFVC